MAKSDLTALTAAAAAAEIARGAFSSQEYVEACLDKIDELEDRIGAFAHLDPDYALEQAKALDDLRLSGRAIGPLHGLPVAVKDIVETADYPTEYGSAIFSGHRPRQDATVVAKLRAAGAVIIGKTVTTEFAYFHPGKTKNPHDPARTPGGSSSGSAAAVAAGMVPLAIGTQTNGSLIRPGAFCGVFAVKPTRGLVSRAGVLPLSRTLDHVGGFARTAEDLALLLDAIAGHDAADPDTRPVALPSFRAAAVEEPPIAPRFAFIRTPVWDDADADARAALEALAEETGAQEIEYPVDGRAAWDAHRAIMAAEMAHNLGRFADKGEVSAQLRALIDEGRKVTAGQYLAALRDMESYAASLQEIFEQYAEAILTLSAPGVAPPHDTTGSPVFCSLWTLAGLPAVNVPLLANSKGLPIGVQLVGMAGRDERLLRAARVLAAAHAS